MLPNVIITPLAFVLAVAAQELSTSCSNIHIISARGSNEAPGTGTIGSLGNATRQANSGVTIEALDYPATLTDYADSSGTGTKNLQARLNNYTSECPSAKIVLMGYSQGAHVVGDAICGGGDPAELIGPFTPAISDDVGDKVVAMIQMGDPRHVPNLSYDVGSATRNGLFPRTEANESCSKYASKIKSYCDEGDPYCATGLNLTVHLHYLDEYSDQANDFINQQVKSSTATGSSPSSTHSKGAAIAYSKFSLADCSSIFMLVAPFIFALVGASTILL